MASGLDPINKDRPGCLPGSMPGPLLEHMPRQPTSQRNRRRYGMAPAGMGDGMAWIYGWGGCSRLAGELMKEEE